MIVDARNKPCPQPVVLALGALPKLAEGESLEVLVTDEVAVENLSRMAAGKGRTAERGERDGGLVVTIGPSTVPDGATDPVSEQLASAGVTCPVPDAAGAVIAFGSDTMGRGDDELGHILVKGLIYALANGEQVPSKALFFNTGAHLTCEGSESLDDIRQLVERGCEVFTCGTCLEFYGIKEKLGVGSVTNLYAIAETLTTSPRVVTL